MPAQTFLTALKKRLRRIHRRSVELAEQCRKNALHDLRVDLKTLRAQLRLLRAVDPEFPYEEVYAPFKALFARAGQLRFWQLQLSILSDTPGVPEPFARRYRAYVRLRLREALKDFRQTALTGDLFRWREIKNELRPSWRQRAGEPVDAYFADLRQSIAIYAAQLRRKNAQDLHELRKQLKEYAANRRTATRHFGIEPGPPLIAENILLDDALGEWHDLYAACAQLRQDLRELNWGENVRSDAEMLLQTWQDAERLLWQEIARLLKNANQH